MAATDFTKGSEGPVIFKFAIPIIAGNIFMQLYNYVDSVIVGRFVGKEALAAVGASVPFVFMLVSLAIGVSMGSTIIVAQFYGRKEYDKIRLACDSLYIFLIIASLIITTFGILFSRTIFKMINLPEEIIPIAAQYLDIYLLGLIFLFIFNSLAAVLRGVGDSRTPLLFLAVSAVLNLVLDLLFVPVFGWGLAGAAWATVIAQAAAVGFAINHVNRKMRYMKVNFLKMRFNREIFFRGLKLGIPAGAQQLLVAMGQLAILSVVNCFGVDVIAAYTGASRIESFVAVLPMNLGVALTSFTAQNFGAGRLDRVSNGLKATIKMAFIAGFVVMLLLSGFARPLMSVFSDSETIIHVGSTYLWVLGFSFWIFCVMFCLTGAMRGLGNTIAPMFISLLALWIVRVPMAKFLSEFMGEMGIWLSATMSWSLGAVTSLIIYRLTIKRLKKNGCKDKPRVENTTV